MSYWIIDRIEEGFALCQNREGELLQLETGLLPADVKEGDCLYQTEDGVWSVDQEYTRQRREKLARRMRRLFRNRPGQ